MSMMVEFTWDRWGRYFLDDHWGLGPKRMTLEAWDRLHRDVCAGGAVTYIYVHSREELADG